MTLGRKGRVFGGLGFEGWGLGFGVWSLMGRCGEKDCTAWRFGNWVRLGVGNRCDPVCKICFGFGCLGCRAFGGCVGFGISFGKGWIDGDWASRILKPFLGEIDGGSQPCCDRRGYLDYGKSYFCPYRGQFRCRTRFPKTSKGSTGYWCCFFLTSGFWLGCPRGCCNCHWKPWSKFSSNGCQNYWQCFSEYLTQHL